MGRNWGFHPPAPGAFTHQHLKGPWLASCHSIKCFSSIFTWSQAWFLQHPQAHKTLGLQKCGPFPSL